MLSPEQIDRFQQQGFLVLERLIDAELLDRLESEYSAALDTQIELWRSEGKFEAVAEGSFFDKLLAVNAAGLDWFQPLDITLPMGKITADTPFHMGPAVFDLLTYEPLLDAAESIVGSEMAITPIQHVRIKPPRQKLSETEDRAMVDVTAWHQDRGVAHEEADATLIVTAWVAVTDATCENGCLTVIPGEANDALLTHCPEGQTHIPDSVLDKSGAVPVEIPRGSVLLLHPSTPHASLPNNSDGFRWSFDLRFHRLGDPSGRSHFPSFVARSRTQAPVANWQEMRDTWLAARDRLAQEAEIPLHRWRGDASVCA